MYKQDNTVSQKELNIKLIDFINELKGAQGIKMNIEALLCVKLVQHSRTSNT